MKPALFLDRDGVINVDHGYVHTPEKTDFVPGIFELVRAANAQGWPVLVVTNQAGIARGYYDEAQFHNYMDWVRAQFVREGAHIDAVYFCPHHPEQGLEAYRQRCTCRKPAPGMLLQAIAKHRIDAAKSVMVGDTRSDMQAARAAGVGTRLLLLPSQEEAGEGPWTAVLHSLHEALPALSAIA